MNATKTEQQKYGFSRAVDMNFDEATEKTREALKTEGFGVLSEIRLDEKLKEKLGVDFRRYVILGACMNDIAAGFNIEPNWINNSDWAQRL